MTVTKHISISYLISRYKWSTTHIVLYIIYILYIYIHIYIYIYIYITAYVSKSISTKNHITLLIIIWNKKINKPGKVYFKNYSKSLDTLITINDLDFENIKLDEKPNRDIYHLWRRIYDLTRREKYENEK